MVRITEALPADMSGRAIQLKSPGSAWEPETTGFWAMSYRCSSHIDTML
jgi:hypothetical protein